MPSFPLPNTAYNYRPLKLTRPTMSGWDIYGLQTGLAGIPGGDKLQADGIFGKRTEAAVFEFQRMRFKDQAEQDGVAGIGTQRKLASVLCKKFTKGWDLPEGCPYGHVEKESGGLFGNHAARYPNGSYDIGLCQRNTQFIGTWDEGFDAPDSLHVLCKTVSENWVKYADLGKVDKRRAFELACGSWNAPAWTATLAAGGTLSASSSVWIEGYIERVTSYIHWDDVT